MQIQVDGSWHELDLTSKTLSDSLWVLLRVSGQHTVASPFPAIVLFKEAGNTNDFNVSKLTSDDGQSFSGDCWVRLDSSKKIEYNISASMLSLTITIGGYM